MWLIAWTQTFDKMSIFFVSAFKMLNVLCLGNAAEICQHKYKSK